MKNNTSKLRYIIALLAILNATTIGTIIYHNSQEQDETESVILDANSQPLNGRFFRHELGFDNDQMEVFRTENRKFRQHANLIIDSISSSKERMFAELQAEHADTIMIHRVSLQIGSLHSDLKETTAKFYLSLSKVCDATQKEKLKIAFSPLFKDMPLTGCGHGAGKCNGNK